MISDELARSLIGRLPCVTGGKGTLSKSLNVTATRAFDTKAAPGGTMMLKKGSGGNGMGRSA